MDLGLDVGQLRDLVVRPALQHIDLWSPAAERLVLGTAIHESKLRYLKQIKGPALGVFQMEPATYRDLQEHYLAGTALGERVNQLASPASRNTAGYPDPTEMIGNLKFAAAMCRVFYRRIKTPLPAANDVQALAEYAKRYYNTYLGKATVEQYRKGMEMAA